MIYSVTVTNHLGEELTLELGRPEKSGFLVKEITGLGPVNANINTSNASYMDGVIFNSARLDKRNIVFSLMFIWDKFDIETIRHMSYKFFPVKRKVTLTFHTDYRTSRIEGCVESNDVNIFSSMEDTQISIICPDPSFYEVDKDGDLKHVISEFYGVTPIFEFSFENDSLEEPKLEFGSVDTLTEKNVYYEGDMETGLEINIFALGLCEYINIINTRTNERMIIDTDKIENVSGIGIIKGDQIVINTEKGHKSATLIRYGERFNILNCITRDSDWFLFSHGDNPFVLKCDYGTENLKFSIRGKIAYDGV